MIDLSSWSWQANASALTAAACIIAWAGTRLAGLADRLADRTGLGEAITGAVFLGMSTSLAGITASVTAALEGNASLAISNAMGGIAVQTVFLGFADLSYRKANLEHAAASIANMMQAALLVGLLGLVLIGLSGPEMTVLHVNPAAVLLPAALIAGFWLVYRSRNQPMWQPRATEKTVADVADQENLHAPLGRLLATFCITAAVVAAAGALVAHTSGNIARQTGMSETLAGALLCAVATSLPELITTVASVKRGAFTLAVSDIVGGNCFDVLFIFAADAAYIHGSLYHAAGVGGREIFLTALTLSLNVVLLLGLMYRQKTGPANVGFENVLILVLYIGGYALMTFAM
jgi:cation:H+ antiporter